MTVGKAVLIFPTGMPRALEFLGKCLREQREVIGASSLPYDPSRQEYPAWLTLPYINHDTFDTELAHVLHTFNIGGIYTPHPVIWDHLNRTLQHIAPGVSLLNDSPANTELDRYRAAQERACELLAKSLPLAVAQDAKPDLTKLQVASLYLHVEAIPGMCDHEKVRALYEVARYCPAGDVVEIGSWWGKSAFIFLRLAQCFDIGNLLCVDPWSDAHLLQNDKNSLVDLASAKFSAEEALDVFQINLLPYSNNDVNYLRMPSTDGARFYQSQREVETPAFGKTNYAGHIALLHIDGNHSYENAQADMAAWSELVVNDGWIVMDDYTWPFGDGPRRVGDEFLTTHSAKVKTAFVMGGALFIQVNA